MLHHARRCIQMNLNHSLTSSLTHSWSRAVTLSTVASFDMFNPTHEHKMLRTTIRDFIEKEVDLQALAFNRYHTLRSTYCIWLCCHSNVHVCHHGVQLYGYILLRMMLALYIKNCSLLWFQH